MNINAILGWTGTILFVLAYLLLSLKLVSSEKILYHGMNMFGGVFLSFYSILHDDIPNFSVNFIWMCIAMYSIGRIIWIARINGRKSSATP
jgi:hypothetical protein